MLRAGTVFGLSALLALQLPAPVFAASQTPPIVTPAPSAPPVLFNKALPEGFRCQRFFTYDGRTYGCDSNFRQDGERLRQFLTPVPEAVDKLNLYQKNRRTLQNTAYFGTAGLLMLIAGVVAGNGHGKQLMLFGGTGILAGSFIYCLTSMRANEAVLGQAVDTYNQKRGEKAIQLQFSTGIGF